MISRSAAAAGQAQLLARIRELESELREARDTLDAFRCGDVDAVIVNDLAGQHHIYTLETADRPYQFLIEQMQEGAATLTADGTVLYCNRRIAEMLGLAQERAIGQDLRRYLSPADNLIFSRLLEQSKTSGVRGEVTFCALDGTEIPVQISVSPLSNSNPPFICGVFTDLTGQKANLRAAADLAHRLEAARDRSEQASRAKSRFLAGMSHELRTPLNGILGHAHLLKLDGGLTQAQTERVGAMLEAGKHLLEMITCVLDLSEIEAEHVLLRPVDVDVEAIAAACLDLLRPIAEAKGLALGISIQPGVLAKLTSDPTRLRQIMLNLLGNATKFTSSGSIVVRLQAAAGGSALRIAVVDTGPGISADRRQLLFQDFGRLDADRGPAVEGAGLGLSISARLAQLMGGNMGYDDNPGGGSVFWLELPQPIAPALPANEAPCPSVAGDEVSLKPMRALHLLIVDDVEMNRDIASSMLVAAGHATTCVEGGAQAIAAVASTDFDVVLMDIRMPGMDGLEATRRIRALPGKPGRVPIIALTAHAFAEQIVMCRNAGMNSHLPKPFEPDALLAAVAKLARGQ
jgi:PAS domain S-box-containing protein